MRVYSNKIGQSCISFEEFQAMVISLGVDLKMTGIGKGCWKFDYEDQVYKKV